MHIHGPSGNLEARHDRAPRPAGIQAVLCHPHPRYGGTMADLVLDCLTGVLLDTGVSVLRFNFRGVGGSVGHYDDGRGEVDDLLAAAAWVSSAHPHDVLWVGGYSFGAWVAWQALDRGLDAERVMLVAPPVGPMRFAPREAPAACDVVIGTLDDFADPAALATWPGITLHRIPAADHFFTGRMETLAEALRGILG